MIVKSLFFRQIQLLKMETPIEISQNHKIFLFLFACDRSQQTQSIIDLENIMWKKSSILSHQKNAFEILRKLRVEKDTCFCPLDPVELHR